MKAVSSFTQQDGTSAIGNVIVRSIKTFAKKPIFFLGLSLMPFLCSIAMGGLALLGVLFLTSPVQGGGTSIGAGLVITGLFVLLFCLIWIVQGAFCHAVMQLQAGERPAFWKSISLGTKGFFPLLLATLPGLVAIFAGLIFYIVPGLIVATFLAIFVPVYTVERRGVFSSIKRGVSLASGFHWRIGILLLILGFVWWGAGQVLKLAMPENDFSQQAIFWEFIVLKLASSFIAMSIMAALLNIVLSIVYLDLRAAETEAGGADGE